MGSAVGTPRHTLRLIYKTLNLPVINLPKIRNGIRINKEEIIYRSEFNHLPPKTKECFDYSVAWTEMADKAVAAERRAINEYKILHDEMSEDNQIRKQIADLKEKLTIIKATELVAGKIGEAQTFWKYEGVPAPGDDEKTPITADASQLIINDLKDVTATFERLNRNRNTVKLQEEILCTKEYLDYLKSILVMFTNTDSIQTTIDETEDSIMIYDGIITRRIQEAEKFYDTFRKEKSYSRVGKLNNSSSNTSFPSDSEDEEVKKRKIEESNEKPEIPEISSRLMRIRLEMTEEEVDEADTGDHDGGTEEIEEKDYGADESKLSDNSRKRNAARTERKVTQKRS